MDYDEKLLAFGDFVKGTCQLMCPLSEQIMREREQLLHPLERLQCPKLLGNEKIQNSQERRNSRRHGNYRADPTKTVKVFSRSAAGLKMPSPSDLRPFPVLDETVSYLIEKVACIELTCPEWLERYNFVADRLRAVRQDMVIQGLPPSECIILLEPMVRFHVFGGYWLCEKKIEKFDPSINSSLLQECIKHLLVMYDRVSESNSRKISRNSNPESNQTSNQYKNVCTSTQHMMEALYLVINLGDSKALNRGLTRIGICNCRTTVESTALQISISLWRKEYVRVCQFIKRLPPILSMAAALHLPSIRRHSLLVMNTAYSSKTLKYPLAALQNLLLWNDQKQVREECLHYGIPVDESDEKSMSVHFQKGSFDLSVKQVQPSRLVWLDESLSSSVLTEILLSH